MDNRIMTLMLALGVSPGLLAAEASFASDIVTSGVVLPMSNLRLHFKTKLILEKLKEREAISLHTDEMKGAQLIIHGEKLDDEFFGFLSKLKNVKKPDEGKDLVVSDGVAAAMSKFGELNDLINSSRDEALLEELQKKMGTDLDKVLRLGSAGSFS